ncbi:hypothetical protein TNCV_2134441 [Trichonephila clavipes]|nr:hypothetical protein TNCV_2134441 [Trichonephila clavipes]
MEWCGSLGKGMPTQLSSSPLDRDSKLRDSSPIAFMTSGRRKKRFPKPVRSERIHMHGTGRISLHGLSNGIRTDLVDVCKEALQQILQLPIFDYKLRKYGRTCRKYEQVAL